MKKRIEQTWTDEKTEAYNNLKKSIQLPFLAQNRKRKHLNNRCEHEKTVVTLWQKQTRNPIGF